MEYRRFNDTIIARIDKGEEIVAQVRRIAEAEQIKLASVEALGALSEFNVGLFDVVEKKFHGNHFEGAYEVVSLTGTINTKDGEFYTHLHIERGRRKRQCVRRAPRGRDGQRDQRNGHTDPGRKGRPLL